MQTQHLVREEEQACKEQAEFQTPLILSAGYLCAEYKPYTVALFKSHLSEVATLSKDVSTNSSTCPQTCTLTLSFPALFFFLVLITFWHTQYVTYLPFLLLLLFAVRDSLFCPGTMPESEYTFKTLNAQKRWTFILCSKGGPFSAHLIGFSWSSQGKERWRFGSSSQGQRLCH